MFLGMPCSSLLQASLLLLSVYFLLRAIFIIISLLLGQGIKIPHMRDLEACSLYNFFLEPVWVCANQMTFQHRTNMYVGEYQPSYQSRFITHTHHHHHHPSHGGEIVVGKDFAIPHISLPVNELKGLLARFTRGRATLTER